MGKTIQAFLALAFVIPVWWAGAAFIQPPPVAWPAAGFRLLGGTAAVAAGTFYTISLLAGVRPAARFLAATLLISWLAEVVGLQGNRLFGGEYRYHPGLWPVLPGGVPAYIPFAWFMVLGIPVMLLRGLSSRGPEGKGDWPRIVMKSAAGAWGAVACDLALDPVSVAVGIWNWVPPGPYFGVPWLNFVGWWVVAFGILLTGYAWAGLDKTPRPPTPLRFDLCWSGANLLLLVFLARAACNHVNSLWPVAVCLAGLLPLLAFWHRELFRKIRACWP